MRYGLFPTVRRRVVSGESASLNNPLCMCLVMDGYPKQTASWDQCQAISDPVLRNQLRETDERNRMHTSQMPPNYKIVINT